MRAKVPTEIPNRTGEEGGGAHYVCESLHIDTTSLEEWWSLVPTLVISNIGREICHFKLYDMPKPNVTLCMCMD